MIPGDAMYEGEMVSFMIGEYMAIDENGDPIETTYMSRSLDLDFDLGAMSAMEPEPTPMPVDDAEATPTMTPGEMMQAEIDELRNQHRVDRAPKG